MADSAGTPLWLTLALQAATLVASLVGTHFLARSRERTKKNDDLVRDWRKEQLSQLRECVELARKHYLDPAVVAGTQFSASKIIDELKRLRARFGDVDASSQEVSADASKLYIQLHELVTGPDDFQDANRQVRTADDAIFGRIHDCEAALSKNFKLPRKTKP